MNPNQKKVWNRSKQEQLKNLKPNQKKVWNMSKQEQLKNQSKKLKSSPSLGPGWQPKSLWLKKARFQKSSQSNQVPMV